MAFGWLTDFHTANFSSLWQGIATVARRVFGTGSSFRMEYGTMGGVWFLFFGKYWRGIHFGGGIGHWTTILWGLDNFLIFPSFPRS